MKITRPLQLRLEALRRTHLPSRPLQLDGERGGQVRHARLRRLCREGLDQSPDVSPFFEPDPPESGFDFGSVFGFFSSPGEAFGSPWRRSPDP